jgi:crotonobetainyl-CoA:carnitine CoA-transferase CaiB-like acyl-CoA transferase
MVDTPVGKIKSLLPPGIPEEFDPRMDPIPAAGEHSTAILKELGYGENRIEELRQKKVI